jgi:hypothetical protein
MLARIFGVVSIPHVFLGCPQPQSPNGQLTGEQWKKAATIPLFIMKVM